MPQSVASIGATNESSSEECEKKKRGRRVSSLVDDNSSIVNVRYWSALHSLSRTLSSLKRTGRFQCAARSYNAAKNTGRQTGTRSRFPTHAGSGAPGPARSSINRAIAWLSLTYQWPAPGNAPGRGQRSAGSGRALPLLMMPALQSIHLKLSRPAASNPSHSKFLFLCAFFFSQHASLSLGAITLSYAVVTLVGCKIKQEKAGRMIRARFNSSETVLFLCRSPFCCVCGTWWHGK